MCAPADTAHTMSTKVIDYSTSAAIAQTISIKLSVLIPPLAARLGKRQASRACL